MTVVFRRPSACTNCVDMLHVLVLLGCIYIVVIYMTLIGVHELHGQMHPNQGRAINLLAIDPLSLFGYLTVSPIHPVTGN